MIRSTVLIIVLILAAGISQAGASETIVLNKEDSGRDITIERGGVIEIRLRLAGGTGYLWEFEDLDRRHFEIVKEETEAITSEHLDGGPVMRIWRLKATEVGTTQIIMYYYRPWEGKSKAVERFLVTVCIR